jgi:hypothetical protein
MIILEFMGKSKHRIMTSGALLGLALSLPGCGLADKDVRTRLFSLIELQNKMTHGIPDYYTEEEWNSMRREYREHLELIREYGEQPSPE